VTTDVATPAVDWLAIAPVMALVGAALIIVMLAAIGKKKSDVPGMALITALAGIALSTVFLLRQWKVVAEDGPVDTMAGMVRVDGLAVFLGLVIVAAALLALLVAAEYLEREGFATPEYLALMLLSAAGMLVMTTANDLVVVFIALEVLSIPLYVLAAFDRRRERSQEAGIKYFVLGAFSSAIFLYGVALTYGATGTTNLAGVGSFLATTTLLETGTLLAGIGFLLVGIGFKIAAVPFHAWTPDVYEGAPTPVTSFMASATKAAGFAALLRVFVVAFPTFQTDWRPVVLVLSAASMIVGSVAAVAQTDIKRLLAYSSIANAGYVLVGFAAVAGDDAEASRRGIGAMLAYLAIYAAMVIGSFAIVTVVGGRGDRAHDISQYRGLAWRKPLLAGLLTYFLLAQAGVPLTGGFVVKLQVFAAAADAQQYWLVIVGVLAAVVLAAAYLRVAVTMIAPDEDGDEPEPTSTLSPVGVGVGAALLLAGTFVLVVGVLPGWFLELARDAATRI
jgi:NADH-quinone oxidoreductase subunit N